MKDAIVEVRTASDVQAAAAVTDIGLVEGAVHPGVDLDPTPTRRVGHVARRRLGRQDDPGPERGGLSSAVAAGGDRSKGLPAAAAD